MAAIDLRQTQYLSPTPTVTDSNPSESIGLSGVVILPMTSLMRTSSVVAFMLSATRAAVKAFASVSPRGLPFTYATTKPLTFPSWNSTAGSYLCTSSPDSLKAVIIRFARLVASNVAGDAPTVTCLPLNVANLRAILCTCSSFNSLGAFRRASSSFASAATASALAALAVASAAFWSATDARAFASAMRASASDCVFSAILFEMIELNREHVTVRACCCPRNSGQGQVSR